MKICFVGPASSSHIIKWSRWFSAHGHEVHIVSFIRGDVPGAEVHYIETSADKEGSDLNKLGYLTKAGKVRKAIRSLDPDVINVHYATSYGTVMALTGIRNYTLSVWGSDIYEFPRKSFLHRNLLTFSLNRSKYLFSTSQAMAKEASLYTKKAFDITPFGVDMYLFSPSRRTREENDGRFVIGIVKYLEVPYGIDHLIRAAAIVSEKRPDIPFQLRIVGDGTKLEEYRQLAKDLRIDSKTVFPGRVSQDKAGEEWANMDLAVVYSNQESFGVSAIEAQACGVPVIVSNVGGLPEVTEEGKTSMILPPGKPELLAEQIIRLYDDKEKREKMGEEGRKFVSENYELDRCFLHIEKLLKDRSKK